MKVEEKLKKSGYALPEMRRPEGVYTLAKRVGNLLYIAGQTADINGIPEIAGIVGKDLTIEDGKHAARISALNVLSVIKTELGDLDHVKQFVQIIGFVRCADDCANYTQAIDGASELFHDLYGDAGLAARMAIGAKELPGGSAVEIMTTVEVKEKDETLVLHPVRN